MNTRNDARFWDRIADKYSKGPIRNEQAYEQTLERARAHIKPTDRVLELGCGTGTTALRLADASAHTLGTDISPAMIDIARRRATEAQTGTQTGAKTGKVDFAVAPVDSLPNGPFDVVMAFNLLHLLRDLDGALAHIHDRLRPGGVLISKTICMAGPGVPLWMRAVVLALPVMQLIGKAPYFRKIGVRRLEQAITAAGFEIIETGNYPDKPPLRFIVARKPA